MGVKELVDSNFKQYLVTEIQRMDLDGCSNNELIALRTFATQIEQEANLLTLEGEIVGYTYHNLGVLSPMIAVQESKRGICLTKKMGRN